MKKKIIAVIIIVLCALLILTGFYFVLRSSKNHEADVEVSEVEYLINTNLKRNYPATPRAAVNLYCRMLACFYNEEMTEEELLLLLDHMYYMYDDELQEANPQEQYEMSMKADLLRHEADGYRISDYIIPDTDEVTKKTVDGEDMALMTVSFYVKDESGFTKSYQDFILRKDPMGDWKILGYSLH